MEIFQIQTSVPLSMIPIFPVTTVENKIDPGKVWKATVQAYIDSRVGFLHADIHTKSLKVIIN